MKFKPGDRCLVLPPVGGDGNRLVIEQYFTGRTVTLVSYVGEFPHNPWPDFWLIAESYSGLPVHIAEVRLEKIQPQRQELGSWDECPWRPAREVETA